MLHCCEGRPRMRPLVALLLAIGASAARPPSEVAALQSSDGSHSGGHNAHNAADGHHAPNYEVPPPADVELDHAHHLCANGACISPPPSPNLTNPPPIAFVPTPRTLPPENATANATNATAHRRHHRYRRHHLRHYPGEAQNALEGSGSALEDIWAVLDADPEVMAFVFIFVLFNCIVCVIILVSCSVTPREPAYLHPATHLENQKAQAAQAAEAAKPQSD